MVAAVSVLHDWRTRPGVVVLTGVLLAATACTGGHHGGKSSPAPSAPTLTSQRATSFATALSSGIEQDVRGVVLVPAGQPFDPNAVAQLKAAGPVTFDLSTFGPVDATHATVSGRFAHPPAGQPATWTFDLTWLNGQWMITDTEPAQ
jgi:hypothetical protein